MKRFILSVALAALMAPMAVQAANPTVPLANAQVEINPATGLLLGLPITGGATGSTPTAVSLSGTAIQLSTVSVQSNMGAGASSATILAAVAGKKIVVTSIEFSADQAMFFNVRQNGGGGFSTRSLSNGFIAAYGGIEKDFSIPFKCSVNTALDLEWITAAPFTQYGLVITYYLE